MRKFYLFSKDYTHRYKLLYEWDRNKSKVFFIMLNPSVLTSVGVYGPTTRKIISYSKSHDYGGVWIGNLFSFVSSSPKALLTVRSEELTTDENDFCLRTMANDSKDIFFAWGAFPLAKERGNQVRAMFPFGKILYFNPDLSPAHPLSINFKS